MLVQRHVRTESSLQAKSARMMMRLQAMAVMLHARLSQVGCAIVQYPSQFAPSAVMARLQDLRLVTTELMMETVATRPALV